PEGLKDALKKGLIIESDIDISVSRVLKMKFRLGLFENPYVDPEAVELDNPEEQATAKTIAEKSITLLKNDGILPLSKSIKKLAVIGPNANDRMALFGNYSFENHVVSTHFPDKADQIVSAPTVFESLRERFSADQIKYAQGCEVMGEETRDMDEAVTLAREADLALVVVGDKAGHFRRGTVGEGTDTANLALPGRQAKLIEAIIATDTPTVIVLLNGRPFALGEIKERAAAIVEAWFPGQAGAEAITDVLFGDLNPGGKTTLTFSQGAGAQPSYYNHKFLANGLPRLPESEPVFPFGHGLSYTNFEYSELSLSALEVPVDGQVAISCTIRNTGGRAGDEVIQLYLQDLFATITRPVKELKGFIRLGLQPGETKRVSFTVKADLLSFTGTDYKRIVEPGAVKVMVGASSEDIRLTGEFKLTGSVREVSEDRILTSEVAVDSISSE
ncbi:MAG: glycoside hydrolase family 3 C-terminal domain-containing protein, partial [Deltaproteobacteria bacterium]|nr:glycoside hydrolase family 3 C-terminal domain-containing protein [Deltaproteobacteria bacterium]